MSAEQMDKDAVEGIISSIVFSNAENGYTVLRLDTANGIVTAAGCLPGVSLGEHIVMSGTWSTHPQYGEQFKTETFEIKPPSGIEEIFRYLASGAVKNIGPGRAREIVDMFGATSLNIIENDPDKLSSIKGISLKTARKIGEDYRRLAGLRQLIDFFRNYNIKPLIATRVYKIYGDEALPAVRDNPYIIAFESCGAEFFEADSIALDLGFESDSPQRVSAALIFTLTHNLGNGHTFIPCDKLTAAVSELIGIDYDAISEAMDELCEEDEVVVDTVLGIEACYLKHIYDAEQNVAMRLLHCTLPNGKSKTKTPNDTSGFSYSKLQLEAIELAANHGILALTGGPGTGKTTTVRGILKLFEDMGLKTVLCAPTGRAAKRLSELCGFEAATIHRLLGANLDEGGRPMFEYNEHNQLDADAIIVDESSMIDILLMDALLCAIKPDCRIIMVGDADQLPPIGPGNMFSDVIRSDTVPVIALTEIFRQAADSGIIKCAHSVNKGIMPDFTEKYPDLFFMQRRGEEQLAETIAELYSDRLPKNMNIDPSQIQVLSPTRKRASGTVALNEQLREKLNPQSAEKKEKLSGSFLFRTGDKVMQIKNNYDTLWTSPDKKISGAGVFNGDVGTVCEIDHSRESVTVLFDDKLVTYTFDQLAELEPAFAMTVHKSQGSEYHAVILAMTGAAPPLLTRSVLYTAMTRAKSLLVIVGSLEIMNKMVQNDKRQKRYSGLRARLAGGTQ
ncbi:MAG: ATP-dependent RecD-like DNA helicase [Oscillospiraceae bacterium]|nr:ATP-dependent RecD-like DNA helicase [Oscillospiraceae bacterium]